MRDYGLVYRSFWTSADIRALTDDGRLLALYALTSPHANITGAYRLPVSYAAEDLQWIPSRVLKGLAELSRNGFATFCEGTQWLWVHKAMLWDGPQNPNQWKSARKAADMIPDACSWKPIFLGVFTRIEAGEPPEFPPPNGTVTKPFRNPVPIPVPEPVPVPVPEPLLSSPPGPDHDDDDVPRGTTPKWFEEFKAAYPKRTGSQSWSKALKAARARMREGSKPAEFIAGAQRYAAFIAATGKGGTEFVKMAASFLGPDKHYLEPWTPPTPLPVGQRPTTGQQTKYDRTRTALGDLSDVEGSF
jgi:hypothetical protein